MYLSIEFWFFNLNGTMDFMMWMGREKASLKAGGGTHTPFTAAQAQHGGSTFEGQLTHRA